MGDTLQYHFLLINSFCIYKIYQRIKTKATITFNKFILPFKTNINLVITTLF